ncbi:MAG: hypothetical protein ACTHL3_01610 [Candidatus Nitrosocosmicus sp.]
MILITATLVMGIKSAYVFAQGNNSTNSTSSLKSYNKTVMRDELTKAFIEDAQKHTNTAATGYRALDESPKDFLGNDNTGK